MAGPLILKDALDKKSTEDVTKFISNIINNPKASEIDLPGLRLQNENNSTKYKVCVLKNGKIEFPEGSPSDIFPQMSQQLPDIIQNTSVLNERRNSKENADVGHVDSKENRSVKKDSKNAKENVEPPKEDSSCKSMHSDADIFNKLVEHYRQFNEKQLGLKSHSNLPNYTRSSDNVRPVTADEMIKEAALRLNKEREEGEIMKEPTITDGSYGTQFIDEFSMYSRIPEEIVSEPEVKASTENLTTLEIDRQLTDMISNRNNHIEKTLQNRIDTKNDTCNLSRKWETGDVIDLANIISKERKIIVSNGDDMNVFTNNVQINENKDDILSKIKYEEISPSELSLFDRLKMSPAKDDHRELQAFISDNCNPTNKTDKVIHSKYNVYSGGEELNTVVNYTKSVFRVDWLWNAYETIAEKLRDTKPEILKEDAVENSEEPIKSVDETIITMPIEPVDNRNNWPKLRGGLEKIKRVSAWLSGGWLFSKTGKPIYKQLDYNESAASWQPIYNRENEDNTVLKKRNVYGSDERVILSVANDNYCTMSDDNPAENVISSPLLGYRNTDKSRKCKKETILDMYVDF